MSKSRVSCFFTHGILLSLCSIFGDLSPPSSPGIGAYVGFPFVPTKKMLTPIYIMLKYHM